MTGLFLGGAAFGYLILLPQSLPILFSFQSEGLAILISYKEYYSFVLQMVMAMGISFEIPLVIMLLTAVGVVTPAVLNRFRRFAIVLACIAGAILSPGTDVLSMILMTVPILLLYEVGFVGSWLIYRGKLRNAAATAAMVLVGLSLCGTALQAQQPDSIGKKKLPFKSKPVIVAADSLRSRTDTGATDSLTPRPGQAVDTATARRLGLPTAPRHAFAPDDSVLTELLARPGYQSTRFRSDSAVVFAGERRLLLRGEASTRRGETTLEADSIAYQESSCLIRATGDPALFDKETVLSGFGGIRYNTLSTLVYIAMGWLVVIAADTVWTLVPKWGIFWLFAGGIAYTLGAVFFLAERIRFFHFVWHLFVIAGTACHFVAVLWYSA